MRSLRKGAAALAWSRHTSRAFANALGRAVSRARQRPLREAPLIGVAEDHVIPDSEIPYELLMKIQEGTLAYTYRGVPMLKNPFDLALYPLLLDSLRPRTLIEIGANAGGSAMWFADQARLRGLDMRVVSVDLTPPEIDYPNVAFLPGDARALDLPVNSFARPLLVVEDSDQLYATVRAVLAYFDRWFAPGDWIVIEDGIVGDVRIAEQFDGATCATQCVSSSGRALGVTSSIAPSATTSVATSRGTSTAG
jgi:cephalosporin hydroxylase